MRHTEEVIIAGGAAWDTIMLIDRPLQAGASHKILGQSEQAGGCELNTARWAERAGGKVKALLGCGDDALGERVKRECSSLDVIWLSVDFTPTSLVIADSNQERSVLINRPPEPSQGLEKIKDDDLLWVSWSKEEFRDYVLENTLTPWKATRAREVERGLKGFWRVLVDSADHTSRPPDKRLAELGCELCVITKGAEGCEYWTPKTGWERKAPHPATSIDATGAGDAFLAGLLTSLAKDFDIQTALEKASELGAHATENLGASPQ